ncbi:MAG: hypothetical protein AAF654_10260 [Myxococcota bacterium]
MLVTVGFSSGGVFKVGGGARPRIELMGVLERSPEQLRAAMNLAAQMRAEGSGPKVDMAVQALMSDVYRWRVVDASDSLPLRQADLDGDFASAPRRVVGDALFPCLRIRC